MSRLYALLFWLAWDHLVLMVFWKWEWALLIPKSERPPILNEKQADFTFFKFLSRALGAWVSSKPPVKLFGTQPADAHLDIPAPGKWVVTYPLYFAFTTKGGIHGRLLNRYDYIDGYYRVFAIALKRIHFN